MNEKEIANEYLMQHQEVKAMRKEIRENEDGQYGTDAQKNDLIRDLNRKWASRVDDYRRMAADARQERLQDAKKQAFNLSGPDARNALQIANSIDKDALEKEYRKADERSDNTLKHALAYTAYKSGNGNLLEQWAGESPSSQRQVSELRAAEQDANDLTALQNFYTSYGPINAGGDTEWLDK